MDEQKDINLKIVPPLRNLPWVAVAVAVFLVLYLGIAAVNQYKESKYIGQSAQYKNTITLSGEGKVLAKPDIGQVSLSVLSEATTVAVAQKDNTEKMNKIIQGMKDLGVAENDLKTVNYSINPSYQYTAGRSIIIGYQVSQTLEVKIRNLEKVSDILGKAAELGSNQVGSLSFTFDDPNKLKAEARQKAVDNAKQKAQDLAKSLGVSLGKIVSFSESVSGEPTPIYYGDRATGMGGGGAAPNIQTGQNEIQVNVSIAYEIF